MWKQLVSLNVEDKVEYLYHHFSKSMQRMSTEITTLKDAPETKHTRLTEGTNFTLYPELKEYIINFADNLNFL